LWLPGEFSLTQVKVMEFFIKVLLQGFYNDGCDNKDYDLILYVNDQLIN
jgi:hypothetical protein